MPLLFVPHEYSVIIGKGRDARDAPGTRTLRAEIQSKLHLYRTSTGRLERAQIVSDLLSEQQRRCPQGGVFVKFDGERWWELSEHDARENITAAFRNRLHEKYTSSSKFKSAKRRMQLKTLSSANKLSQQKNEKADHQQPNNAELAVALVLLKDKEDRGQVQQRMMVYEQASRSNHSDCRWKHDGSQEQTSISSTSKPYNSCWWYPNKIYDDDDEEEEEQEASCLGDRADSSRKHAGYGEDNKATMENNPCIISSMLSSARTTTSILPGTMSRVVVGSFHPFSITPPTVQPSFTNDHLPQGDGSTTIASSSSCSSSSSGHDEENDSLDSSCTSHKNSRPLLPSSSSSAIMITPTTVDGKSIHPFQPATTRISKRIPPAIVAGRGATPDLSNQAELKLWAACYLPPVVIWNGLTSRLSPGGGGEGPTGRSHDMMSSHGWSQFQVVDALLEPVNPSIFEE